MVGLTERQKLFLIAYLRCFNATESAKLAGYSERTAYSQGKRLLKNVEIQKYLTKYRDELMQDLQRQFIMDALAAKKVMYEILTDPNASNKDRIIVAKDFLDRAGFKPIERKAVSGLGSETVKIVFTEPASEK